MPTLRSAKAIKSHNNFEGFSVMFVQLGELGEELAREKPAQSKVEMLEAQVRIMQEKLSKVSLVPRLSLSFLYLHTHKYSTLTHKKH